MRDTYRVMILDRSDVWVVVCTTLDYHRALAWQSVYRRAGLRSKIVVG